MIMNFLNNLWGIGIFWLSFLEKNYSRFISMRQDIIDQHYNYSVKIIIIVVRIIIIVVRL